jgi:hypothetical protein
VEPKHPEMLRLAEEIREEHLVSAINALCVAGSRMLYDSLVAVVKKEAPQLQSFSWRDAAVIMDRFEMVFYSLVESALLRTSSVEDCSFDRSFDLLRVEDISRGNAEPRDISSDKPMIDLDRDMLMRLFGITASKLLPHTTENLFERTLSKTCSLIVKQDRPVFLLPGQRDPVTRSAVVSHLKAQQQASPLTADPECCEHLRKKLQLSDSTPVSELHQREVSSELRAWRDFRMSLLQHELPYFCAVELKTMYDPFQLSEELVSDPVWHPVNLQGQLGVAWVIYLSDGHIPADREELTDLIEETKQFVTTGLRHEEEKLLKQEGAAVQNTRAKDYLTQRIAVYFLGVRALEQRAGFVENFLSDCRSPRY